ncbi:decaprenyl-phosphate phosphoribosyltransferase [Leptolyngbya sp. FACHB-17]|uniref:decaprenyl-phosphate phosphoribosyltransferase n=1 Tax=unclassified Leptolyngbya TaxID=2650499 RepID=UPI00168163E9|nr:decaprenyl-phosphate phosphoribosyltransferase [Leptolyngbya sp. FACHB-17]MBD2080271.1 decaprenyl-phosphate phosphoribosyltransferase [Leptolyngbya sp. FACHB-17]
MTTPLLDPRAEKTQRKASLFPYVIALRPHQWTKNLVVFAAPLFAFSIGLETALESVFAFALFCCVSSSFYLINDIADVKDDRAHPIKCKRPIASGAVKIPVAVGMAVTLLTSALVFAFLHSIALGFTMISYAALQTAYNLRLKRMVILDIIAIAMGFVLRAYAGASATEIRLSIWFVLCTAMLALFLGIEKRKAELRLLQRKGGKTRSVLRKYSMSLLTRMESTVVTGTVLTYALWSAGPKLSGASTPWMVITLPFVLYGVFRYQLLSEIIGDDPECDKTERPDEVLLTDLPILLTVLSWVATVFAILLLKHYEILQ